jgi:hypothetical protein
MTYNLFFAHKDTLERIFLITKTFEPAGNFFTRMSALTLRKSVVLALYLSQCVG